MSLDIKIAVGNVSEIPKTPLVVECRDCKHRWTAVWLPMGMAKVAKVLKNCKCPMCGGDRVYCAPEPSAEPATTPLISETDSAKEKK